MVITALCISLIVLVINNKSISDKIDSLEAEQKTNLKENKELTKLVEATKEELEQLEKDVKSKDKKINSLKENNNKLSKDFDELEKASNGLKKQNTELKQQKVDLEKNNNRLKEDLSAKLERDKSNAIKDKKPQEVKVASSTSKTSTKTSTPASSSKSESASVVRTIQGQATAYTRNCAGCTGITASGKPVKKGMIAADPSIPFGTKVRVTIEGYGSQIYTVEDRGGAIKGNIIDVFMDSEADMHRFGRRSAKIEILK